MILASGAKTDDEVLTRLLSAAVVNHAMGGAVVGPGDVDGLQEDFIDGCNTLVNEVPKLRPKPESPKGRRYAR
mgnify:CR=1 FL=1